MTYPQDPYQHQQPQSPAPVPYSPGPPAYGQPVYYVPPSPPRPTSGLALASMICGIGGMVLCFIVLPSIAAVILGHLALKETSDGTRSGKGQAITGLVLGYVVCGIALVYLVVWLIGFVASQFD